MGIDFIGKVKRAFRTRESKELRRLQEQNLFGASNKLRRTFRAQRITDIDHLKIGDQVALHMTEDGPVVHDNVNKLVAIAPRLADDIKQVLRNAACGIMMVAVERVFELSNEIELIITSDS